MDILKKSYLVLGTIFLMVICFLIWSNNPTIHDLSLNLLSEIIGIFLTVFLIDYAIQVRERKEKIKIVKNALIQFKRPMNSLMSLLISMYKASCDFKPVDLKDNYRDIFSTEHFYNTIRFLDFKREAPILPRMDWSHYSAIEIKNIKESLDKVLDKYAFVLDSKIISEVEWINNSSFLFILSTGVMTQNADIALKFDRKNLNLLAHDSVIYDMKIFLTRSFELVDYLGKQADEISGLHYDSGIWGDNIAPKISSGRIQL